MKVVAAIETGLILLGTVPVAAEVLSLPEPRLAGESSVEEALAERRSVRSFGERAVSLEELSQLLWAAQGVTDSDGGRTSPSAGATYPLELFVVAGEVEDLTPGVYRYLPRRHALRLVESGDVRRGLTRAAGRQSWIVEAPVVFVFTVVTERTSARYGERAERYVAIEVGCAAENLALQGVSLGLGSTMVGAFDDAAVGRVIGAASGERPFLLVPMGPPSADTRR